MITQDVQKRLAEQSVIVTPEHIAEEMINALPKELWSDPNLKNKKFLDICCKSGVFLKALLNKLMVAPALANDGELKDNKIREKYILDEMLYGVAVCKLSLEFTRLNLYNKAYIKGNIRQVTSTYGDYVEKVNKNPKFIEDKIKETFGIMKIDVVIGNPPYNNQIYKKFISLGNKVTSDINAMITPATWSDIHDETFELMDKKCNHITYYPDAYDCFDIKQFGGISWFICSNKQNGECTIVNKWNKNNIHNNQRVGALKLSSGEICLLNGACSIIEKILAVTADTVISTGYVSTEKDPYGVSKYFDDKNMDLDAVSSQKDEKYTITAYQSGKVQGFVKRECLSTVNRLEKYKLCVHERLGFAALPYGNEKVIGLKEVHGVRPNEIPVISEIALIYGDSIEELTPFYNYYRTKFLRFLTFAGNMSSHYTHGQMWRFVPMQDFTENSDIDWSQHIADIDKQLYKKYNLSAEEIDYIEATIKPMQ